MYQPLERVITYSRVTRTLWKMFKFGAVGIMGTLIGLGVLYMSTEFLHVYYMLSALIGTCTGFIFNFFGNVYLARNIRLE